MPPPTEPLTASQLRLVAEIAFTGVFYGLSQNAKDIFDYIRDNTGHREIGVLGNALGMISDGKYAEAVQLIEKDVLQQNPDSVEGQMFAALALKLAGQVSHSERLSERASKNGSASVKEFAKNLSMVENSKRRPNY